MKAMILAAGRGERMRPLTDRTPKPLLMVGGKRLIEYHLINLANAGFKDVVINVAWLGKKIIDTLGNGEKYNLNIIFSNEGDRALETAGGIANALPLLGAEPFLVINADIWTDYPLVQLNDFQITDKAHLVLVRNPIHNLQGDFSITNGYLQESRNDKYTYSGIGIYTNSFFSGIRLIEENNGQYPLAPMIKKYIAENEITGELYQGKWMDIGTQQRLKELEKRLLE